MSVVWEQLAAMYVTSQLCIQQARQHTSSKIKAEIAKRKLNFHIICIRLTLQTSKAIIVPHWIIWSWYTGRWWVGCYIWYSEEGPGWAAAPPSPLLAVPNVTAHPSTASVPITVLLYDRRLLCGFNVSIKGLKTHSKIDRKIKDNWKLQSSHAISKNQITRFYQTTRKENTPWASLTF